VRGLFYGIGHQPNSGFLAGQVELDAAGYVVLKHGPQTSVEGVFCAGDLHDVEWRQAVTAAGAGCAAALAAERYLSSNDLAEEFHQDEVAELAQQAAQAAARQAAASASASGASPEEEFDPTADRHKGQYALRKLYHDASRPMMVLYTGERRARQSSSQGRGEAGCWPLPGPSVLSSEAPPRPAHAVLLLAGDPGEPPAVFCDCCGAGCLLLPGTCCVRLPVPPPVSPQRRPAGRAGP
jgi:hypothetical protein